MSLFGFLISHFSRKLSQIKSIYKLSKIFILDKFLKIIKIKLRPGSSMDRTTPF